MKVYTCPEEIPAPNPDYMNYNRDKEQKAEASHQAQLKAWLIKSGYTGKRTGQIFNEPMADGYAQYMLADGPKSALIHLPYGDAYHSRNVQHLPKAEVIRRIAQEASYAKLFKGRG